MTGPRFTYWRARLRAGALVRGLQEAADRLRPGYFADAPYVCARGHVTTRVHPSQYAAIEAGRNPSCRHRDDGETCGLEALLTPVPRELERHVSDALHADREAAMRLLPGLAREEQRGGPRGTGGRPQTTKGDNVVTIIPKEARKLAAGDVITRHPDHPEQRVRYLVTRGARDVGAGVLVDYTAPADEIPHCVPNGRASGVLMLDPGQPCHVEAPNTPRIGDRA